MGEIQLDVDPREVGLCADRLARIDRHFERYVDDGRLPGWLVAVARDGKVAHLSMNGHRAVEERLPIERDTLFRIYSMTKPITSVAAMMLFEEAAFELDDPVARFIPAFADTPVYRGGSVQSPVLETQTEPMRMWHLLTHMSGLTYGFHHTHVTDALYRNAGFDWGSPKGLDLEGCCEAWAKLPLVFQPGSGWNYGVSTDVLGRVVEVISGRPLDVFLRERIFEPLGMGDTAFHADEAARERLAALYIPVGVEQRATRMDLLGRAATKAPACLSGGGGLVSSAHDYQRFVTMLLNGGELDGERLLSPRTLAYMTRNHLPGGVDLETLGQSTFSESTFDGVGFGLGFSVTLDPVAAKVPGSAGEYGWGGAASTVFWVDPVERITVLFLTQLLPSSTHPIRPQLKQLVQQAILA